MYVSERHVVSQNWAIRPDARFHRQVAGLFDWRVSCHVVVHALRKGLGGQSNWERVSGQVAVDVLSSSWLDVTLLILGKSGYPPPFA